MFTKYKKSFTDDSLEDPMLWMGYCLMFWEGYFKHITLIWKQWYLLILIATGLNFTNTIYVVTMMILATNHIE